jgi:hypothetical protein
MLFDLLPTGSSKYCKIFNIEKEYQRPPRNGAQLTFDKLVENLKMFDSNDISNWQISGFTMTLLVSDTLAVIMNP